MHFAYTHAIDAPLPAVEAVVLDPRGVERMADLLDGRMAPMFMRLFTHNPIDRVLRFLDDRPTMRDVFGLMGSLPPLRYLAAFGRWLLARIGFRGAIPVLAGASASSSEGEVPEGRRGRA